MFEIDRKQGPGVPLAAVLQIEDVAGLVEARRAGVHGVLGSGGDELLPFRRFPRFAGLLGLQQHRAPLGGVVEGESHVEVVVGHVGGDPGILLHQRPLAGFQIDPIDVVQLRDAIVEPHEDFIGEILTHVLHLGVDVVQRRQVFGLARGDVGHVDVPVLVPGFVLGIEDVVARVGPVVPADVADLVLRHRLGRRQVVDRGDPDVENPIHGSQIAEPFAVGAEAGIGPLGVAEQYAAGNQGRLLG